MDKGKIKVVWLCHFSNSIVHEKLELKYNPVIKVIRKLAHKSVSLDVPEFANWITNGIKEFESFNDVELHVVSPYPNLKNKVQEFEANGIFYHFFRSEDDEFTTFIYKRLFHPTNYRYKRNSKIIKRIIERIRPDIIHLFGAENPEYALASLLIAENNIVIAQLQTLMNDPDFKDNYPISERDYNYRAGIEKEIIQKVNFLGTPAQKYRQIIKNQLVPDAVILNTSLALKDPVVKDKNKKQFDFVYFAANISKAGDLALEAFGLAYQKKTYITLDVIGKAENEFKVVLDKIIQKYGISDAVTFEGKLPTHSDVLKQIRKSRFALLPLKIDLTSGTIREAMSNGLPVVTTDTGELGTQKLNLKRQNVLISPVGDHKALAANMIRLLEDNALAETLRENAFQTREEAGSNRAVVTKYVETYMACLDNYRNNKPLPVELTEI